MGPENSFVAKIFTATNIKNTLNSVVKKFSKSIVVVFTLDFCHFVSMTDFLSCNWEQIM